MFTAVKQRGRRNDPSDRTDGLRQHSTGVRREYRQRAYLRISRISTSLSGMPRDLKVGVLRVFAEKIRKPRREDRRIHRTRRRISESLGPYTEPAISQQRRENEGCAGVCVLGGCSRASQAFAHFSEAKSLSRRTARRERCKVGENRNEENIGGVAAK